jgi:hypothetical protein
MVRLSLSYIKAENVYRRHGGYSSPRRPTHASSLDVLSPQLGCVSHVVHNRKKRSQLHAREDCKT